MKIATTLECSGELMFFETQIVAYLYVKMKMRNGKVSEDMMKKSLENKNMASLDFNESP
jgi:hypothetical protein